jgi:WD40 repeat protein
VVLLVNLYDRLYCNFFIINILLYKEMGCGGSKTDRQVNEPVKHSFRPVQMIKKLVFNAEETIKTLKIEDEEVMHDEDIRRILEIGLFSRKGQNIHAKDLNEEAKTTVGMFEVEIAGAGDQMLAVKPWIGAIKPPTNPPRFKNMPPSVSLQLEYVYGYRCFDSRQNLYYTTDPAKVVYMTAAVGVVLNKSTNTQDLFGAGPDTLNHGHTDDITALALHPEKDIVATGEVGKNPKICIWRTSDPTIPICEFRQGKDTRAVSALGFSFDGNLLASVDLHNDHYVRVWDWKKQQTIFSDKSGPDRVFDLCWSPVDHVFCTAGVKHIYFWKGEGYRYEKSRGLFGNTANMCNMTCVQWMPDGTCVTGATNGSLYHWAGNSLKKAYPIHQNSQAIHALRIMGDSIYSGGNDNCIRVLDFTFTELMCIEVSACPKAIDVYESNILAGLRDGSIFEILGPEQKNVLMESHSDGELWGVCVVPNSTIVITVADDNKLKVWDSAARKCIATKILEPIPGPPRKPGAGASSLSPFPPNQQARAVCINSSNGHIAIGHNDGRLTVLEGISNLDSKVHGSNEAIEWIEAMSYSPDGRKLAVGSHDNYIYIYDVNDGYRMKHRLTGHSSFIIALDWSVDGTAIHSNCGAYELLFFDVNSGKQLKDGATRFRDEPWATWTAKLGWHVQGIYRGVIDLTHVNTVDRSRDANFIAVGNDWGLVEIFNNPNGNGAKSRAFKGHSEHVTRVVWGNGDRYLFSGGGYDQSLMQWKVIR